MKNISLILNGLLIIAVGVLYYLHFSSGEAKKPVSTPPQEDTTSTAPLESVVYLNADSLLENYDFFKDSKIRLEEKTKNMESKYANRASRLQKEIAEFQNTAKSLTMNQAKALQEDLMKKEQNLRLYQESLTQELLDEENKINNELYENLSSYLEKYSQENNVSLVLKYNRGSDVLYASKGLEITQEVIDGLNVLYKSDKEQNADTVAIPASSNSK